jgi:hypothetical protein
VLLTVRHVGLQGSQARGQTENVSERGAMISVDIDPPLAAGDRIELDLEFDWPKRDRVGATVRWASAVLPGMVGVEFDSPIEPEITTKLAKLIAQG